VRGGWKARPEPLVHSNLELLVKTFPLLLRTPGELTSLKGKLPLTNCVISNLGDSTEMINLV